MGRTLREIYEAQPKMSPRTEWLNTVAEVAGVTPMTVRFWLMGRQIPTLQGAKLISQHLGVPVEELFPGLKNK